MDKHLEIFVFYFHGRSYWSCVGMQPLIILKGITSKGKQRLAEWGTEWAIKEERDTVIHDLDCTPGSWFYVVPVNIPSKNNRTADVGARWVHSKRDTNFKILIN